MNENAAEFRSTRHDREVRVASWQDAEELAAWHMRSFLGFHDAAVTRSGPDGGLDAIATSAAAQVKHYAGAVGAPEVQRLVGAAHATPTRIFYAQEGFTDSAVTYAESAHVALFTYNVYGDVASVGEAAVRLLDLASFNDPEARRMNDEAVIAYLGGLAECVAKAFRTVEVTRETDVPVLFVCAELAVQLAVAAAVRDDADAVPLCDCGVIAALEQEHPRLLLGVQRDAWAAAESMTWGLVGSVLSMTTEARSQGWAWAKYRA